MTTDHEVSLTINGNRFAGAVEAVASTGVPSVLLLVSGRPLSVTTAAPRSGAILHAWVPGQEGLDPFPGQPEQGGDLVELAPGDLLAPVGLEG